MKQIRNYFLLDFSLKLFDLLLLTPDQNEVLLVLPDEVGNMRVLPRGLLTLGNLAPIFYFGELAAVSTALLFLLVLLQTDLEHFLEKLLHLAPLQLELSPECDILASAVLQTLEFLDPEPQV